MKAKIILAGVALILFGGLCLSVVALRQAGNELARVKGERDQATAQTAAYKETAAKARAELAISQLAVRLCRDEAAGLRATLQTLPPVQPAEIRIEQFKPPAPPANDQGAELLKLALKLLM